MGGRREKGWGRRDEGGSGNREAVEAAGEGTLFPLKKTKLKT
jgi:hypothetical protein